MASDFRSTVDRVARPGVVGSLGVFWPLIEPVLDALNPRSLCEVGVENGAFAALLLAWCRAHGCRYFGIDPAEIEGADELLSLDPTQGKLIKGRSLDTLPALEACNAYFLDGDHNFYTVRGELAAIAQPTRDGHPEAGPIVFLHDVGWPWGRRDMYYAPETIPADCRHEFSETLGTAPDRDALLDGGLRAPGEYAIATHAGGERNGVLTAVEAFVADAKSAGRRWEFFAVPAAYGLGVLYQPETLPPACRERLEAFRASIAHMNGFLQTLDASYVELFLFAEEIQTAYQSTQTAYDRLQAHADAVQRHADGIRKHADDVEKHAEGVKTHADGVQKYADGIEKSFHELEGSYQGLLTHSNRLLNDYQLLDAHRQRLESENASLRAGSGAVAAPDEGRPRK